MPSSSPPKITPRPSSPSKHQQLVWNYLAGQIVTQPSSCVLTMGRVSQLNVFTIALLFVFAIALDSMWGLIHRNGYYETLRKIRDDGPRLLPGSDTPIRARYTGIYLIDYWLAVMNTVLANVTDGSALHLSLYSIQFAGQLGSITTILMIEGMCQGRTWTPLSW